ncbi:hypothetical protein ACS0TY_015119 [Phlomoides rotata]
MSFPGLSAAVVDSTALSLESCVDKCLQNLITEVERSRFAVMLWCTWFARNQAVFEGKILYVKEIVRMSAKHMDAYLAAQQVDRATARDRLNRGSSFAGVLRDCVGVVQWGFTERTARLMEVDLAEATTILRGMEVALGQGIQELIVEADALGVISAINRSSDDLSILGRMVRKIKSMSS